MTGPGKYHEVPEFSLEYMQALLDAGYRDNLVAQRQHLLQRVKPKAEANLQVAKDSLKDVEIVLQRLGLLLDDEGGAA